MISRVIIGIPGIFLEVYHMASVGRSESHLETVGCAILKWERLRHYLGIILAPCNIEMGKTKTLLVSNIYSVLPPDHTQIILYARSLES